MAVKIENKPLKPYIRHKTQGWADFIEAVPKLKIGQSFLIESTASNYRLAAAIAKSWLGIQLNFVKEGDQYRVGRTA